MFVLLEHTPPPESGQRTHWDFMLELPGRDGLATWRLTDNPVGARAVRAERIGDHRRAYLEYEGALSGNRGAVRRVDRGRASIESETPSLLLFALAGDRLRGRFLLARRVDGAWDFRQAPPTAPPV